MKIKSDMHRFTFFPGDVGRISTTNLDNILVQYSKHTFLNKSINYVILIFLPTNKDGLCFTRYTEGVWTTKWMNKILSSLA